MILKGEGKKKIEKEDETVPETQPEIKPETDKPKTYLGLPKHKSIADSNKKAKPKDKQPSTMSAKLNYQVHAVLLAICILILRKMRGKNEK